MTSQQPADAAPLPPPPEAVAETAVRRHFVTPEQLADCLAAQARAPAGGDLGALLVKRGFLSPAQRQSILTELGASEKIPVTGFAQDAEMARAAVRAAVLEPPQLTAAVVEYFKGPSIRRLIDILTESGAITAEQVSLLNAGTRATRRKLLTETRLAKAGAALKSASRSTLLAVPRAPSAARRKIPAAAWVGGGIAAALLVAGILLLTPAGPPRVSILQVEPRSLEVDGDLSLRASVQDGSGRVELVWVIEDITHGRKHEFRTARTEATVRMMEAGSFRVGMWAIDEKGRRANAPASDLIVEVSGRLGGDFAVTPPSGGIAPLHVDLESRVTGGTYPLRFEWQVDNETRLEGPKVRATLQKAGKHVVLLRVEDKEGRRWTKSKEIVTWDPTQAVAIVEVPTEGGSGTGWVVEHKGERYFVTNEHVVAGPGPIYVTPYEEQTDGFTNRPRIPVRVAAVHREADLVVLKPQSPIDRPPLTLSESRASANEKVRIIGYSAGLAIFSREGTLGQYDSQRKLHWMNAPVNPGDSGGPVIRLDSSEVVGVTVMRIESRGLGEEHRIENLCLAIPVSEVRETLETAAWAAGLRPGPELASQAEQELSAMRDRLNSWEELVRQGNVDAAGLLLDLQSSLNSFAYKTKSLVMEYGTNSDWGAVLFQAQSMAKYAVDAHSEPDHGLELIRNLHQLCKAATAPGGKCSLCSGRGKLSCRVCQGYGSCRICRKSAKPSCVLCSGTGRCRFCAQVGTLPCYLCDGRKTWK